MEEKRLVSSHKSVYTVGYLRSVSWHMLERAKVTDKGKNLKIMASIVFSAFTLEAYLNHLGEKLIHYWITIEKNLSPYQKLEVISTTLNLRIDNGQRPFQSFREIFRFRNFLAHGRTEKLTDDSVQKLSEGENPELPKTEWQEALSIKYAQRYLDDTLEMINVLHDESGLDFNPIFTPEIGGWTSSIVEEQEDN